jgi:hypothetical protein
MDAVVLSPGERLKVLGPVVCLVVVDVVDDIPVRKLSPGSELPDLSVKPASPLMKVVSLVLPVPANTVPVEPGGRPWSG